MAAITGKHLTENDEATMTTQTNGDMTDFLLIMLCIAPLGLAQLHSEGRLNIRGVLIEPVMMIVNLFRGEK